MKPKFRGRNRKEFGKAAFVDCPKQYREGRRCKKCKKSLSMYNRMNECFSHGVDENTDIPKTIRRTSLKKRIDEEEKVFQWMQNY